MDNNIYYFGGLASIILIILIWFIFLRNKKNNTESTAVKVIENPNYFKKEDIAVQKNYDKNKSPTIILSLKEKIELSWKFLYEITDIVLKKFNNQDKNLVVEIGQQLYKNGVQYNHVVDTNAMEAYQQQLTKDKKVEQDVQKTR